MRKLIIDGNAVYELDENCMLLREISAAEEEKKELQKEQPLERKQKKE